MTDQPTFTRGQPVECRNAYGDWVPMVATGPAHRDRPNAVGGITHLTVPVATRAEWRALGERVYSVNWPIEDVRAEEKP